MLPSGGDSGNLTHIYTNELASGEQPLACKPPDTTTHQCSLSSLPPNTPPVSFSFRMQTAPEAGMIHFLLWTWCSACKAAEAGSWWHLKFCARYLNALYWAIIALM
jgi:hypothetical protein